MPRSKSVMKRFSVLLVSVLLVSPLAAAQKDEEVVKDVVSLSKQFKERKKILSKQYIFVKEDAVNRSGMTELKIGDAPTKEQLKVLKEDMVWIKEEEIAGFKMFFPVVYLAEKEKKMQADAEKKDHPKRRRRRVR